MCRATSSRTPWPTHLPEHLQTGGFLMRRMRSVVLMLVTVVSPLFTVQLEGYRLPKRLAGTDNPIPQNMALEPFCFPQTDQIVSTVRDLAKW